MGFQEMFQGPFGQLSVGELPRATVAREKMGKFLKVFDAMKDMQDAQIGVPEDRCPQALAKSVERTIEHLAKLAEKGEKLTSPRDLMRTWYSIADRTLMEKFNTKEFLEVQDKLTDALMNHKKAQRDALEIVYNALEIPTRSEIDEAYRDIHAMKREVRALQACAEGRDRQGPRSKARARKPKRTRGERSGGLLSRALSAPTLERILEENTNDAVSDPVPAGRRWPTKWPRWRASSPPAWRS